MDSQNQCSTTSNPVSAKCMVSVLAPLLIVIMLSVGLSETKKSVALVSTTVVIVFHRRSTGLSAVLPFQ